MIDGTTRPTKIEGVSSSSQTPWQTDETFWSFGPAEGRIIGPSRHVEDGPSIPHSRNTDPHETFGPQEINSPRKKNPVLRHRNFGNRGLEALFHWEGLVEDVTDEKFRARLMPLTNETTNPTQVEFTDFSFEDLANESDRELVTPGAIFYWTIARAKNAAGTLTNVSLVRFRRTPAPTNYRQRKALEEAEELLRVLTDADESPSA